MSTYSSPKQGTPQPCITLDSREAGEMDTPALPKRLGASRLILGGAGRVPSTPEPHPFTLRG